MVELGELASLKYGLGESAEEQGLVPLHFLLIHISMMQVHLTQPSPMKGQCRWLVCSSQ